MDRKKVKTDERKRLPSKDKRIKEFLKEGPLVGFYFNVAVTVLYNQILN